MKNQVLLGIGALLFGADAFALDQAQIASQVKKALAVSPLTPEQKVQHALSRMGYGPNPAANGVGVKTFLRYRTDSLGQKFVDAAATDQAIANWVAANIAYVASVEGGSEELIANYPITVKTPVGDMTMKPSTSVAEHANNYFTLLEYRASMKGVDPIKYGEAASALSRIGSASIHFEAQRAMSRAIMARYPLGEALHNFWFNHFNVAADKGRGHIQAFRQYQEGIRKLQGSDFASLVSFTAHHPSMLIYLDNYKNVRPVSATKGINENYAREVMELHTLGQGPNLGAYVQADVYQAARILTGLTLKTQTRSNPTYAYFCATCHDPGVKKVMGKSFAEGQAGQQAFLRYIALHPQTAKNIARKLVNRFAIDSDDVNGKAERGALEARLAKVFAGSSGNLMQLYVSLFTANEFWGFSAYQAKVKQPFEWVASAYRMAGVGSEVPMSQGLLNAAISQVKNMGQPIHLYAFPTGYKDANSHWANTNGINLAVAYGFNVGQHHQVQFVSKNGSLLKAYALDNYFNVRNAVVSGASFQADHGRHSTPICTNGMLLPESDPNFKLFCMFRYLPIDQIVERAKNTIATDVLDFEGMQPTSFAAQSLLTAGMTTNADVVNKVPRPVRTQLSMLLANPKFLRR